MKMSNSKRCAACKSLRRRCPSDCIFAPYFPSTNLERFSCVHKIFGASNVAKMLQEVPVDRRRDAAECMVLEAASRVRDPVHGCVGMITQLRQQIMEAEYELAKTHGLIALCSAQLDQENKLAERILSSTPQLLQEYMHFDASQQYDSEGLLEQHGTLFDSFQSNDQTPFIS